MKIRYSRHSLGSLKKRGISKREVNTAILEGQERKLQEHGTIKCVHTKDGKKLVVIYHQVKDKYTIVTTYYL